jgi:hypothetical protein
MKKTYITPITIAITVTPTASLLLQASGGRTTNDNFSRRGHDNWNDEEGN